MEEVSKFINDFMLNFINDYSKKITEELLENDQVKQERIINIGKDLLNLPKINNVVDNIEKTIITPKTEKSNTYRCIHKWTRGNHIPGTLCGSKTMEGFSYCKLHKKDANKSIKTEPKINTIPKGIIIKEHPRLKKFWHPETRLVFEIIESKKTVIARLSKKENILKSLREKDLDTCKCYGFLFSMKTKEELLKIENPLIEHIFTEEIQTDNLVCKEIQTDNLVCKEIQTDNLVCKEIQTDNLVCKEIQSNDDNTLIVKDLDIHDVLQEVKENK